MGVGGGGPAAPIAWSARLAITLVRGLPGTMARHRLTIGALGLRKRHQTIIRRNSPTIRGMINQVKRHLAVETEEMYNARLQREAELKAPRPPIVVRHPQAGVPRRTQPQLGRPAQPQKLKKWEKRLPDEKLSPNPPQ